MAGSGRYRVAMAVAVAVLVSACGQYEGVHRDDAVPSSTSQPSDGQGPRIRRVGEPDGGGGGGNGGGGSGQPSGGTPSPDGGGGDGGDGGDGGGTPPPGDGGGAVHASAAGTSVADNGGGGPSITVPTPAGVRAGDVLLARIVVRDGDGSSRMTAPPGWTKIRTDLHSWLWFRLVGAGDPAGWTWTFSGAFEAVGEILAYSGVDPVRPVDASSGADNPDSQRVTAPSLSTSRPGCLLVYFATIHPTARAIDPPAGMSERNDVNAAVEIESADELWATPGPTGERTGTATAAAHNIGQLVALAPA